MLSHDRMCMVVVCIHAVTSRDGTALHNGKSLFRDVKCYVGEWYDRAFHESIPKFNDKNSRRNFCHLFLWIGSVVGCPQYALCYTRHTAE